MRNEMESSAQNSSFEIDFGKTIDQFKKIWGRLIFVIFATATIGYLATVFLIPKKYTASSKIIIVAKNDNTNQSISYSEVETAQKLTSTYTKIMQSEAISDIVIKDLNLDKLNYDNKMYNKAVSITAEGSTEVMNISATTVDSQLSADIANDVVNVFTKQIYDIMQIENVTVLNTAKVPEIPSSPNIVKNVSIAVLAGLLIDVLLLIVATMHDTKLKTEEDVKEILDYPVIGNIPEFKVGKNVGGLD